MKSSTLDRGTKIHTIVLVVIFVLLAAPIAQICVSRISPLVYASEAIGYRYFHSFRLLNGNKEAILLPQGHAMGLIQHFVVSGQSLFSNLSLRWRLDGFAYATLFAMLTALATGFFVLQRRGRHDPLAVILVASVPLGAFYACRSGISALVGADYYAYEVVLVVWGLALTLAMRGRPWNWKWTLIFGFLLGLMLGIKPPLVLSGGLCAFVALLRSGADLRLLVLRLGTMGLVASLTWILILAAYYFPDPSQSLIWWRWFITYSVSAGAEPQFWESLWSPGSPEANAGADYGYARFLLLSWTAIVGICIWRGWRNRSAGFSAFFTAGASLVFGGLQIVSLVLRPAGTTLWEILLFGLMSIAICVIVQPDGAWRRNLGILWVVMVAVYCLWAAPARVAALLPVSRLVESTRVIWDVHQKLADVGGNVSLIFPNNNHTGGTVEEALLKGFSDYPNWEIKGGKVLLAHTAPGFVFESGAPQLGANAYFWIDSPEAPLPEPVLEAMADIQTKTSGKLLHWKTKTFPWWRRDIHIYVVNP